MFVHLAALGIFSFLKFTLKCLKPVVCRLQSAAKSSLDVNVNTRLKETHSFKIITFGFLL